MCSVIGEAGITAEFKELAVKLAVKRVKAGQGISVVCKELGLSDQTLRNSIKLAEGGNLTRLIGRADGVIEVARGYVLRTRNSNCTMAY